MITQASFPAGEKTIQDLQEDHVPWQWGSKITQELLWRGLCSARQYLGGRLLDLGCGMKPYRSLLGRGVDSWVGLDLGVTPSGRSKADVLGSGLNLPFKDAVFDSVLSTQVLEHV